jgi:hypothetical protein
MPSLLFSARVPNTLLLMLPIKSYEMDVESALPTPSIFEHTRIPLSPWTLAEIYLHWFVHTTTEDCIVVHE